MIAVVPGSHALETLEEFFQLFKTPWEPWQAGRTYQAVIVAARDVAVPAASAPLVVAMGAETSAMDAAWGVSLVPRAATGEACLEDGDDTLPLYGPVSMVRAHDGASLGRVGDHSVAWRGPWSGGGSTVIRLGYDLFGEVQRILSEGQPVEHAATPTIDRHIGRLRRWLCEAGVEFVEVPPVPHGHTHAVALTHDIDFIGIRRHFCDHTMFGFLYRATAGSVRDFLRGRLSWDRVWRNLWAAATLPLVYLRLKADFWMPFPWLLEVEAGLPATYYLIPFKRRPGRNVRAPHAERRGTGYDVTDMPEWTARLRAAGCEIGVHGIDAWHDAAAGREERLRVESVAGAPVAGIRMHWLEFSSDSYRTLEAGGYDYDTTMGYNETVGYRHGTSQVFRPAGAGRLLEMPLHIQDGALFYPTRLRLSEAEARERCAQLIRQAERDGGVLTVLWHDRSHAPDRHWGTFYRELVGTLRRGRGWFATSAQVVQWFRQRRSVRFVEQDGEVRLEGTPPMEGPGLVVRRYRGDQCSETPWRPASDRSGRAQRNPGVASVAGAGAGGVARSWHGE